MNGKGSKQRPTNKAKFDANYDLIFNKQEQHHYDEDEIRKSWRPTEEEPIEWGGKTYQQMYNSLTGEHSYYNETEEMYEPQVEFN